jgi:hypothetical protein
MESELKLYNSAVEKLHEFRKLWTEYYNKYGEENGMMYVYELVKFSEKIDEFEKKCKQVHNRVSDRIKEKEENKASLRKRRLK